MAAVLIFIILRNGFRIGQTATAVVISVPLILAGACLYVGARNVAINKCGIAVFRRYAA